jgi:hypothetical protein
MKKYIDRSAQTRFVEKMTWSKHPKPAIRRTHLRAAEKVSLLPKVAVYFASRDAGRSRTSVANSGHAPKFDARTVIGGTSFVATRFWSIAIHGYSAPWGRIRPVTGLLPTSGWRAIEKIVSSCKQA